MLLKDLPACYAGKSDGRFQMFPYNYLYTSSLSISSVVWLISYEYTKCINAFFFNYSPSFYNVIRFTMLWERKGDFALNNEGGIQVVGIRYMQTNTIGTCFIGITAIYPFSGLDIFQMYAKIKKQIKSRVNWYSKYDIMCEPDFWITRY